MRPENRADVCTPPRRHSPPDSCRSTQSWFSLGRFMRMQRLELATFHKILEKVRVCLQAAMDDSLYQVLQLRAFRSGQKGKACTFNRGVPNLADFRIVNIRDKPDAF